ncbi:NAD(P)-dependent alcohol dehydrogenase [Actinosynnema pretiosum subsp. pretiosum]|uniref:Alcohol dehydrogenase GroES domain protein n=2 Tax=Actinosynnema TaxID=40566 RepID=C6WL31_ACTMD|nr:NAD(P)-dependent alcohol dehydrogenase [Actinosynnema mirum]ACU36384.1 Alcohol dehydrogenase GroES domain protein [Actinosynnema mirum DSM 43827]QUF07798.1 NAD(P)-dependent alcohol dehydrogenase [Actinosynnema pretiosum subsp. pretiosum]
MRAARYDRYGPPEVLYATTVPRPVAGPGEVLVRVHGSSVNGGETKARAGGIKVITGFRFPQAIGMDFAGEVAGVGAGVDVVAPGDRVWGFLGRTTRGAAAEYVVVRPGLLARAPEGVDLVEASALPGVGTTVITALRDKARLQAGERLLVRGASGGLGSVAVQLGKAFGAHVTALASRANLDFVRELGADEAVDYRTPLGELGTYDVVLDTFGDRPWAWRRLAGPNGRMVAVAFRGVADVAYLAAAPLLPGRPLRFFSGNPGHALFADLTRYVESGAIRPVVDTVHPLERIADAHRALEAGGVRGKHVISLR